MWIILWSMRHDTLAQNMHRMTYKNIALDLKVPDFTILSSTLSDSNHQNGRIFLYDDHKCSWYRLLDLLNVNYYYKFQFQLWPTTRFYISLIRETVDIIVWRDISSWNQPYDKVDPTKWVVINSLTCWNNSCPTVCVMNLSTKFITRSSYQVILHCSFTWWIQFVPGKTW